MAQSILAHDDHITDVATLPEVDVRSTDTSRAYMDQTFSWSGSRNWSVLDVELMLRIGEDANIL